MDSVEHHLATIGLNAGAPFGFALAGGHAISAHGILQRPSEDIDLFTDWGRRALFPTGVDAIVAAYRDHGYTVEIDLKLDTFARLFLTGPEIEGTHKVELVANWRAEPPVIMEFGPVVHLDDVMAGKVDALFNRAAPRDFLDLDAALASGCYTTEQLCVLAERADPGFDQIMFSQALGMAEQYPDERFTAYGVTSEHVAAMRRRISAWRAELQTVLDQD